MDPFAAMMLAQPPPPPPPPTKSEEVGDSLERKEAKRLQSEQRELQRAADRRLREATRVQNIEKTKKLKEAKRTLKETERFQKAVADGRTTALHLGGGILRIHMKAKPIKKPPHSSVLFYRFK